jgi:cytochrome d ubiquinol oxidase subunit I
MSDFDSLTSLPYYPVNEFGPAMAGMVIGGLGILHVFLAQFAIGGGMLLCYFEHLSRTGKVPHARRFMDGYFKVLVLVSFVFGALTGVGMWFTTIQVSPRTIGLMVDEFHWLWALEWTFFCLEVMTGYMFYRYGERLSSDLRLRLLGLYSIAAWGSLFWINGILSWQLTPGAWLAGEDVWAGFFNPSFFPSLLYRTLVSMTIAALVACLVINTMTELDRPQRAELIHRAAHFLAPMVLMPVLGLWYLATIPADSRSWLLGGSMPMTMFMGMAAGASLLIGAYAVLGLLRSRLYINAATASLLVALAFAATAAGEFVREGARKPYTVREVLYSNAIAPAEIATLRQTGSVAADPYPLRDAARYPSDTLRLGARVYRRQCSACHTVSGANGLVHLVGSWTPDQIRLNIAKLQHTKAFMPPFAGNAEEVEALAQLLMWESAGAPAQWAEMGSRETEVRAAIARWLDEAGTAPGTAERYRAGSSEVSR